MTYSVCAVRGNQGELYGLRNVRENQGESGKLRELFYSLEKSMFSLQNQEIFVSLEYLCRYWGQGTSLKLYRSTLRCTL